MAKIFVRHGNAALDVSPELERLVNQLLDASPLIRHIMENEIEEIYDEAYRQWPVRVIPPKSVEQQKEATDAAILRTLIQTTTNIETMPQEPAVYRGLERLLSPQIASEIFDRRKRCVMSVLVAQHRGLNVDLIAQVSQNISDKGAAWALTLGRV